MLTETDRILFKDFIQKVSSHFIEGGWITVSDVFIHSAIISDDLLQESMNSYQWDLTRGQNGIEEIWDGEKYIVCREGLNKIEPFVLYREANYDISNYVELSQEFRIFCGMHERYISPQHFQYIIDNGNGDWDTIAEIDGLKVRLKLKPLRQYLAARKMNLLIFFDEMRYSKSTFAELSITPVNNQIIKRDDYVYNYTSLVSCLMDANKSGGWIMGKTVLRYRQEDYNYSCFSSKDKQYVDFLLGYDENGDAISHSCDRKTLSNYFQKNGDEPLEMTPIFFKKEVLDKYYGNPNKYTVSDGIIECDGAWSLRIDNDQRCFVVVMLADLGDLDYNEQMHWRTFNVAKDVDMEMSLTAFQRWMAGNFCDVCYPDLRFKYQFERFHSEWNEIFGWDLFLPLVDADSHRFKTLHCLTTANNSSDFDEQVLSLTKILVDSLNQKELQNGIDDNNEKVKKFLTEKKISSVSELKAGIDKLCCYLWSMGYDCPNMIEFFRKLQSLRSNSIAHRKSKDRKDVQKTYEYFQIDIKNQQEVLEDIFVKAIMTLNTFSRMANDQKS